MKFEIAVWKLLTCRNLKLKIKTIFYYKILIPLQKKFALWQKGDSYRKSILCSIRFGVLLWKHNLSLHFQSSGRVSPKFHLDFVTVKILYHHLKFLHQNRFTVTVGKIQMTYCNFYFADHLSYSGRVKWVDDYKVCFASFLCLFFFLMA